MSDPNPPDQPDGLGPPVDADPHPDSPLYVIVDGPDDCARVAGLHLPRRRGAGARGVLLVDDVDGLVYVLDADDDEHVFRPRERRLVAGSTTDLDYPRDGSDHIIRAAYENAYDVIAAPWVTGDPFDGDYVTDDDDPRPAFTGGGGATPHGITTEAEVEVPAAPPAATTKPRKRTTGGKP